MSLRQPSSVTFEEYLQFCRDHPDEHYEFLDGSITMLAWGSLNHASIALNIATMLKISLKGRPCKPFNSDAIFRLSSGRGVLPDVVVTCDQRDLADSDYIQYPSVIFEVLSPSTEAVDRGRKLGYYRACPTVQEYVLVNIHEQLVELFRREKAPMWSYCTFGSNEILFLVSINVMLPVNDIYEDIAF
jgi:Uma2 family endonuclease